MKKLSRTQLAALIQDGRLPASWVRQLFRLEQGQTSSCKVGNVVVTATPAPSAVTLEFVRRAFNCSKWIRGQ